MTKEIAVGCVGPPIPKSVSIREPIAGDRILNRRQTLEKAGIGKTLMYELIDAGEFPSPVSLGGRRVGWRESEVDAWIRWRRPPERRHALEKSSPKEN